MTFMKLTEAQSKTIKWSGKITALVILLFGLPFYFGYGNPLPFLNPEYSAWDNTWLTVFPLMFLGLIIGLKYEKIGGYLVVTPVVIGIILGMIFEEEFVIHMLLPLIPGILYLISGYTKES